MAGQSAASLAGEQRADTVQVTIKHAVNKNESVEIAVPRSSTVQGVLEALAATLRRDDILKSGRLVTSSGQAFLGLRPTEKLGKRRECLLLGVKDLTVGSALPLKKALALQQELNAAFMEEEFQRELLELEWTYGRDTGQFAVERSILTLKVQSRILPKYGFEGNDRGVRDMVQSLNGLNHSPEFQRNYWASQLLLRVVDPNDLSKHPGEVAAVAASLGITLQPSPSQRQPASARRTGQAQSPTSTSIDAADTVISDSEVFPTTTTPTRATATKSETMQAPGGGKSGVEEQTHRDRACPGAAPADDKRQRLGNLARTPPPADDVEVIVVRTSQTLHERFVVLPSLKFDASSRRPDGEPSVVVEPDVKFQTFLGFGGSFTETACDLLSSLGAGNQERAIEACFSAKNGLGYRLGRLHINSCDFSRGNWSCCDDDDPALGLFSISRYHRSIIPFLQRATTMTESGLLLVASPWSPPAWMKDNRQMTDGGRLLAKYRPAWARFYVRFAEEMASVGFPIWAFTVQNEPMAQTGWENCLYTAEEERDFIRDHLGPMLEKGRLDIKILAWDHNRDELFARARVLYSDPEAAKYIWGMAFHWYGDPRYESWPDKSGQLRYDNVALVHQMRPEKHLVMTEACQEGAPSLRDWTLGERYAENIIRDLNNWTEAWIDWNMVLDPSGGPNHVGNFCSAPILADPSRDLLLFQISFYYLAHFSRYIRPGAQRILCAPSRDSLECTAFQNPDGTIVVIVLNQSENGIGFWLDLAGRSTQTSAPKHSITTYVLRAPAGAG